MKKLLPAFTNTLCRLSLLTGLAFAPVARAQPSTRPTESVTGSWVKTSELLTHADGKTVNSFEKISKAMPCFAGIVYTFFAGGKMREDASGCPATVQKTTASMSQQTTWKQTGDKITLDLADCCAPARHSLFHIRFTGNNEMVWTFVYAENPDTPNPTKAKEMTTTYHRRS